MTTKGKRNSTAIPLSPQVAIQKRTKPCESYDLRGFFILGYCEKSTKKGVARDKFGYLKMAVEPSKNGKKTTRTPTTKETSPPTKHLVT